MKAGMRQSNSVQPDVEVGPAFGEIALNALVAHYGSLKALAITLKQPDSSLVRREILEGNFKRLKACDPLAMAAISKSWEDNFGALTSPYEHYAYLKHKRAQIDSELDQFTESLMSA